jgi:diguanylate cyclase (GGDEF)-like protein
VCKVATSIVGNKGAVCRFGGEEFIILLYEQKLRESIEIAEKIRVKIEKCPFKRCEKVTASFGVSTYKEGLSLDEFIKNVDSLMYLAKDHGRNCIKF